MITSKLTVCAESIVRDAETNTVSVFNVLEEIGAPTFPLTIPKLSVLFILERGADDPETIECVVTLTLKENELGGISGPVEFRGTLATRLIVVVEGTVLAEPGVLIASISLSERELGSWGIRVYELEQPQIDDHVHLNST